MNEDMYSSIRSPKSGRYILINGPTYNKLLNDPKYSSKVKSLSRQKVGEIRSSPKKKVSPETRIRSKDAREERGTLSKIRKMPGCGSYGKYEDLPEEDFCGPEGGACPGTYPVNTPGRYRSCLSYARNLDKPDQSQRGLVKCCVRKAKEKGFIRSPQQIKRANATLKRYGVEETLDEL